MISSRRAGVAGGRCLLLLTVLLGLFGMHALTAHGSTHHGITTVVAASPGVSSDHSAIAHGAALVVNDSRALVGSPEHGPVSAGGPATAAPVTALVTASGGAPADAAGLIMCWLMLTAGVVLAALLLRGGRWRGTRAPVPGAAPVAGPGRPRAPPGRMRLLELAVLRV